MVVFGRDVSGCSFSTAVEAPAEGFAHLYGSVSNRVEVVTAGMNNALSPRKFHLQVFC